MSAPARPPWPRPRCGPRSPTARKARSWRPPKSWPSSTPASFGTHVRRADPPAAGSAAARSPCSPAACAPAERDRGAGRPGRRRGRHRRRHPCADPGGRRPSASWPWPWWTSSTASASSSAPRCARRACQPHMLVMSATPDPALAGADHLRRPGRLGDRRDAGRPHADQDQVADLDASASAPTTSSAGRSRGPPGVHHLPAGGRIGRPATPRPRSRSTPGCKATIFPNLRLGLLHGRMRGDEKDRVDARLRRRRAGRAGRHLGGRGRHRRAQRHRHHDRRRRTLRPGATAPVPRPCRPRRAPILLHPDLRRRPRATA